MVSAYIVLAYIFMTEGRSELFYPKLEKTSFVYSCGQYSYGSELIYSKLEKGSFPEHAPIIEAINAKK